MNSRTAFSVTAAAMALFAAPVFAQTAGTAAAPATGAPAATAGAKVTVGATVYGPADAEVGKIDSVSGDVAVVSTGTNKVTLPLSSFGTGPKGPIISATREQLDAAAASAKAEALAQVTAGATVSDTTGATVGTIKEVDAAYALLETPKSKVRLPLSAFSKGTSGPVIGMTAAQLDAAAAAGAPASTTAPAGGEKPEGDSPSGQ